MSEEKLKNLVKENLIFSCVAGSHAYGLNTPESDIDTRSVFKQHIDDLLNPFRTFDQLNESDNDAQAYSFTKFFTLQLNQNPNIIELLWMPDESITYQHDMWNEYKEYRHELLSTKCFHTFSGYAYSQLKRIRGHNKWLEKENRAIAKLAQLLKQNKIDNKWLLLNFNNIILDKIYKYNMNESFELSNTKHYLQDDDIALIRNDAPKHYEYVILIHNKTGEPLAFEHYPLEILNSLGAKQLTDDMYLLFNNGFGIFDKTGNFKANQSGEFDKSNPFCLMQFQRNKYKQDFDNWKNYWEWKNNRNEVRAELEAKYGVDVKHASHLIRLMFECYYILKDKEVLVRLPEQDRTICWDIKNGKYTYDDIITMSNDMEAKCKELYSTTTLRHSIDRKFAEDLYLLLIKKYCG